MSKYEDISAAKGFTSSGVYKGIMSLLCLVSWTPVKTFDHVFRSLTAFGDRSQTAPSPVWEL